MKKKIEGWRIVVGLLAIGYIIFVWIKKDLIHIYANMPKEESFSLVITTFFVSCIKIAVLAGVLLFIRWVLSKIIHK